MKRVRVPPALLLLGAAVSQHLLSQRRTPRRLEIALSAVLALVSGWFIGGSVWEFRRHRTTVDPVNVESAQSIVVSGPNRYTRNPMYVGMAGMLASHAVLRRSAPALVPAAAFALFIDRYQIPMEEAALRDGFGTEFERYLATVPRWLDRRSLNSR